MNLDRFSGAPEGPEVKLSRELMEAALQLSAKIQEFRLLDDDARRNIVNHFDDLADDVIARADDTNDPRLMAATLIVELLARENVPPEE